jgi:septum formation protein
MPRLILASSSPRRFDLLNLVGLPFEVARPDIDETPHMNESPTDYVQRLSREKAQAVASNPNCRDAMILSADTTVVDSALIVGKPDDEHDAESTLRRLRGQTHQVHTGLTVLDVQRNRQITRLTTSNVTMRDLSDREIAAYVASGDPMGKAGSYAIQNAAFHPVEALDGCYTNVVGLPLCVVCRALADLDINVPNFPPCDAECLPCRFESST